MMVVTLVAALILVLAILMTRFLRQGTVVRSLDEVTRLGEHIDLDAFRNLIDPSEEAYLRAHLPPREFRVIQKQRMLVAMRYVRSTARNAAMLLHFAQYARNASDPQIASAARALADSAVQLRVYSLIAMAIFGVRYLFPSLPLRSSSIVESYGRMCDHMAGLTRIQAPASVAQIEAAL